MEELKKREIPKIRTHRFINYTSRFSSKEDPPKCEQYIGGNPEAWYAYCNETKENHEE